MTQRASSRKLKQKPKKPPPKDVRIMSPWKPRTTQKPSEVINLLSKAIKDKTAKAGEVSGLCRAQHVVYACKCHMIGFTLRTPIGQCC